MWNPRIVITYMNVLNKKRKVQFLILNFNLERFEVLKYLHEEFYKSNRTVMNAFFINTMHVYYERIVIDLAKLFIKRDNDWFNFQKTIEHVKCNKLIENQKILQFDLILNNLGNEIDILTKLRDEEIAHHDKDKHNISLNLKYLDQLELLLNKGRELLLLITPACTDYDFDDHDSLHSVKQIIRELSSKANELN